MTQKDAEKKALSKRIGELEKELHRLKSQAAEEDSFETVGFMEPPRRKKTFTAEELLKIAEGGASPQTQMKLATLRGTNTNKFSIAKGFLEKIFLLSPNSYGGLRYVERSKTWMLLCDEWALRKVITSQQEHPTLRLAAMTKAEVISETFILRDLAQEVLKNDKIKSKKLRAAMKLLKHSIENRDDSELNSLLLEMPIEGDTKLIKSNFNYVLLSVGNATVSPDPKVAGVSRQIRLPKFKKCCPGSWKGTGHLWIKDRAVGIASPENSSKRLKKAQEDNNPGPIN